MKRFVLQSIIALFILVLFSITTVHATSIIYEATDMIDTTPGQDLWEYAYTVSDYSFDTNYGFTIFFDYTLYSDLEDSPPFVNTNWDTMVWQPDLSIPDDGVYDALALVNGASLADTFTLGFVWLGSSAPGPQYFEVYDNTWNTVESGQTAPVPEPATLLLFGSGLLGLAGFKRVRNFSHKLQNIWT